MRPLTRSSVAVTLAALALFGCSLHKWAPLKKGVGGANSEEGSAGGDGGSGGTDEGGSSSTGGSGSSGTTQHGGSSSTDTSATTTATTACNTGFTGTDCAECLAVVNNDGGSDSNSGEAWGTALLTVQKGLDIAAARITSNECASAQVWVAKGTYYPTVPSDTADTTGRTKTIQLQENVALYGGFAGDETTLAERNVAGNVTTLSGDINTAGTATDNAYHVVTGANNSTLDGFTVTAGYADGAVWETRIGAGMYNNGISVAALNCTFRANVAATSGGGLFGFESALSVSACSFIDNTATARPYVDGGGISAWNSTLLHVDRSFFSGNVASTQEGGADGGAIRVSGASADAPIELFNCTFLSNRATHALTVSESGAHGGAVYAFEGTLTTSNCTFWDNEATCPAGSSAETSDGGAIALDGLTASVVNSIIWGNTATTGAEGISGTATVTYSNVQGAIADAANHVLSQDPLFANPSQGDFTLQPTSSCIDAGYGGTNTPTTDILGNARYDVTTTADTGIGTPTYVDMGAYEYQGS